MAWRKEMAHPPIPCSLSEQECTPKTSKEKRCILSFHSFSGAKRETDYYIVIDLLNSLCIESRGLCLTCCCFTLRFCSSSVAPLFLLSDAGRSLLRAPAKRITRSPTFSFTHSFSLPHSLAQSLTPLTA